MLRLKGIDVAELIGVFNLSDSVSVDAKLDGTLPFALGPAGVRFVAAACEEVIGRAREGLNGEAAKRSRRIEWRRSGRRVACLRRERGRARRPAPV